MLLLIPEEEGEKMKYIVGFFIVFLVILVGGVILYVPGPKLSDDAKDIVDQIKKAEDGETISLNEIVKFEWDKLFIIPVYAHEEYVDKVLGFKANIKGAEYEDFKYLVFVKGKEVVCEITGYPKQLGFDLYTMANPILPEHNMKFKVKKESGLVNIVENPEMQKMWYSILHHEWSTYSIGMAGVGIKFSHKDFPLEQKGYFMTYGSGVPVAGVQEVQVKIKGNKVHLLSNAEENGKQRVDLTLEYKDEKLYLGGKVLEPSKRGTSPNYDWWRESKKK